MTGPAALAALAATGALCAAAVRWAFARFSDQGRVRTARRQILASLYEMRLFVDEPAVVLRAQGRLLGSNLRYLGLMVRPLLLVSVPIFLLMNALDLVYGYRPLNPGEAAVVTASVLPSVDLRTAEPSIEATPGITVETPVVRVPGEHRFFWRIRPTCAGAGILQVRLNGSVFEKSVRSGAGPALLSTARVRSLLAWAFNPFERRLPPGAVERIEIAYPSAGLTAFGITLNWMIWFLLAAAATAVWLR